MLLSMTGQLKTDITCVKRSQIVTIVTEIVTIKVPIVSSVRNIDKDMKLAMDEDIEEDVTSPNDNIIAGALKGSSSFSKATVFKNLESLLKESMQHLKKAHKKVVKTPT